MPQLCMELQSGGICRYYAQISLSNQLLLCNLPTLATWKSPQTCFVEKAEGKDMKIMKFSPHATYLTTDCPKC